MKLGMIGSLQNCFFLNNTSNNPCEKILGKKTAENRQEERAILLPIYKPLVNV